MTPDIGQRNSHRQLAHERTWVSTWWKGFAAPQPRNMMDALTPVNVVEIALMDGSNSDPCIHRDPAEPVLQRMAKRFAVPPKLISPGCTAITPRMLPLVSLNQEQIERISQTVPGGAANVEDIYPLGPLQEGILFHHVVGERNDGYLLLTLLEFQSRARLDAFTSALQEVMGRHDTLRSAILWEHVPQPVQVVYRHARLPVEEISLDRDRDVLEQVKEWLEPERQRMDLGRAPLMRLKVAADPHSGCWYVLLQVHHVLVDHDSLLSSCAEVTAFLEGRGRELPEPIPYRNHVAETIERSRVHDAKAFLRKKLGDFTEPTAPFGLVDVHGDDSRITEASEHLDTALSLRLRACARRLRVSMAAVFHAGWGLVIANTSGRDDVVFGTVLRGRLHNSGGGAQQRMGMFLNTLPLRLRLKHISVKELVERTHRELLQLFSYEHSSLSEARRCSGIVGSAPLISALFNYRHTARTPISQLGWASIPGVRELALKGRSGYPISLSVDDLGEGFALVAQTDWRIDPQRITSYLRTAMLSLVEALEKSPRAPALSISILPESERRQVIGSFNSTHSVHPQRKLIHELFEDQVAQTPDAVAVAFEDESLTYAELNRRANQLACYLRDRGIGPEERVGIYLERSLTMMVGLLGILKAGGAYVPLDPNYPAQRLAYMLEDAAPRALLTQEALKGRLPRTQSEVITLDADWSEIGRQAAGNLEAARLGLDADNLAYVIYTSGSTGMPKGVMIEHLAVANLLTWVVRSIGIRAGDQLLAVTTMSFDIAALEVFAPLTTGAHVMLASRMAAADAQLLTTLLARSNVNIMQATPATWKMLLGSGWRGRPGMKALCGGEALSDSLAAALVSQVGSLWNMYGPTETTIWSCALQVESLSVDRGPVVSIGRPISNTQIYLLDSHRQPVPVGVPGEIYIGGVGVGRGYLSRPELTAERFVADPFSPDPQARMYKSGDLGRWRSDGAIEYLGRNDTQVKIRGFRIELGEIEVRLIRHEQIKEAVVIAREDAPGETRLVAYIIPTDARDAQGAPTAEALRVHLKADLPDHMVPSAFVVLEKFPFTPNGKLNRRALPAPGLDSYATKKYEPPQGAIEEVLATLWCEALRVDRIGRHDDFFELGGHSLLGMRLIVKVAERLNVRPPVLTIFQYPTVAQMARLVEELLTDQSRTVESRQRRSSTVMEPPRIGPRVPSDRVPLTFAQQWLWNALKLDKCHSTRTVAAAVRLNGPLNTERLRESFAELVRRHESLRTRIVSVDGIPRQEIDGYDAYDLPIVQLTSLSEGERVVEAKRLAEEIVDEPISLAVGPLFSAKLLQVGDCDHVLVIAMDHMIADAVSKSIVFRDLWEIYGQRVQELQFPTLRPFIQFADYAVWQHKTHESWGDEHGAYWKRRLCGSRRLQLPTHDVGIGGTSAKLGRLPVNFAEFLSAQLRELSRRERTTLAMSLLTAYVALLSRVCTETDLVVTFVAMGRLHPEIENTVGYFNASLFLRIELFPDDSFIDLLRRVTDEYGTAYRHSDSGRLSAHIPEPEFVWNPRFNWIPREFAAASTEQAFDGHVESTAPWQHDFELALREDIEWGGELELALSDTRNEVQGAILYRADHLARSTMERFRSNLVLFVEKLATCPNSHVRELSLEP